MTVIDTPFRVGVRVRLSRRGVASGASAGRPRGVITGVAPDPHTPCVWVLRDGTAMVVKYAAVFWMVDDGTPYAYAETLRPYAETVRPRGRPPKPKPKPATVRDGFFWRGRWRDNTRRY